MRGFARLGNSRFLEGAIDAKGAGKESDLGRPEASKKQSGQEMNCLDCCDAKYSSDETDSRRANCRHDILSLSVKQSIHS